MYIKNGIERIYVYKSSLLYKSRLRDIARRGMVYCQAAFDRCWGGSPRSYCCVASVIGSPMSRKVLRGILVSIQSFSVADTNRLRLYTCVSRACGSIQSI